MTNKYKIMTWNINKGASLAWTIKDKKIQSEIVDVAIEQEADLMVLTEFVVARGIDYLFERLEDKNYIWFQVSRTGNNGILIAIKKNLVDLEETKKQTWYEDIVHSEFNGCNLLTVTLPLMCGKHLSVIGCRMETGDEKDLKKQYDFEKRCFDEVLIPQVNKLKYNDICIICGDFNNARCLGNLSEKFDPKDYLGKAQIGYNLNIIKDTFDKLGFVMTDCNNGTAIPTHNNFYPDDHIFVKGAKYIECEVSSNNKLSDHVILWATIELNPN